jgi:hypothetical protein
MRKFFEPARVRRRKDAVYDPAERAAEKQRSRDQDAEDLRTGRKTAEQLNQENGAFNFPNVRIHYGSGVIK